MVPACKKTHLISITVSPEAVVEAEN